MPAILGYEFLLKVCHINEEKRKLLKDYPENPQSEYWSKETSDKNILMGFQNLKTILMAYYLKLNIPDQVKFCLVDLVEEICEEVMGEEEIKRRFRQCLTM